MTTLLLDVDGVLLVPAGSLTPNEELLAVLPRLTVTGIYLVTNQHPRRAAVIRELLGGRPGISGVLISYEIGFLKPERAFFARALIEIGRTPQECLFVDDKPVYVAGGVAAGIDSVLFHDNARLFALLRERGLL
ncbi:HAD family hydrolase [Catellatospora methionotrophica]|uniref:HAD family hydrolase n=1 Tax=Catellatospora methionotrophica TaxID=121620 RepID=UPI001408C911|nr:HAD-IA family hydrolase [Catellatospora methionotrophica]